MTKLKAGDVVKYSKPQQGEHDFRFVLLNLERGMAELQLVCDYAIKPIETVEESEIELADQPEAEPNNAVQSQPTPTPYILNPSSLEIVKQYDVRNADGTMGLQERGIAQCYAPSDAAFIVRAVNSHAELVAALQKCFENLCEMGCLCDENGATSETKHVDGCMLGIVQSALEKVRTL